MRKEKRKEYFEGGKWDERTVGRKEEVYAEEKRDTWGGRKEGEKRGYEERRL